MEKFWFELEGDDLAPSLFKLVDYLYQRQSYRAELNRRHLRLYGNYDVLGLADQTYTALRPIDRLTLNVIAMNVDTATARIAKNNPRIKYLTEGGAIPLERKAQKLEKFVGGVIYQNTGKQKMQAMFRSGCVFGDGFVKVYGDRASGKIKIDKRFTPNILVDEQDGMFSDPLCIYEMTLLNKYTLAKKFPKQAQMLLSAQSDPWGFYSDTYAPDQIIVVEAWRKASEDGKKDGRHVLCTSNATLLDESYSRTKFPFVKFGYQPKEIGYYSEGISEMLTPIQYELNKTLRTAQQAVNLCVPRLMVGRTMNIVSQHLNNELGAALLYDGPTPPTWSTLVGVPGDLKEHIENLYQKSFERTGLSNQSVFGERPAGLNSGKAIREQSDVESERFAVISQAYEQSYMDLSEQIIDAAEEMASLNPKFSVTSLDKSAMEKIVWKDIDMPKDSYTMQHYPTSGLSKDPSARYDDVADMMDRGLIDKETALSLMEFPDIEGYFMQANSPRNNIRTVVEAIVSKGVYYPPNEYQALELGIPIMNNMLLYYTDRELEPDRLELFARWISDAQALLAPPPPPTQEEAMAQEGDVVQALQMEEEQALQDAEQQQLDQAGLEAAALEEQMALQQPQV